MKRLLIGVGTGRCGTKSLVRLLDHQPGTDATHERYENAVRWNCPANLWPLRLWRDTARVEGPSCRDTFTADVALNWTPHAETFLRWADAEGREVRIIGLKRDRNEVIDSYLRWKQTADHWRFHGKSDDSPDKWDHCYPPEMGASSKAEAIGYFWDRVYGILEPLERKDERVEVFRTEDLNNEEGVARILDFCGYEDPVVKEGIHIQAPNIEQARNSDQW